MILFGFVQAKDLPDIPESFSAKIQVNLLLDIRSDKDDSKMGKSVAFSEQVMSFDKARLEYQFGNFKIDFLQWFLSSQISIFHHREWGNV